MPDTRQIRESYLPDELRVLFIGESPPDSGKFFYCANTLLHDATSEAFAAGSRAFRGEADFPRAFERAGCYLEDLADEPVNGLKGAKRRQACKAGVEPLAERIKGFTPRVVVTVGYGVSDYIGRSLELAGLAESEREKLPFPTSYRRAVDNVPYRRSTSTSSRRSSRDGRSAESSSPDPAGGVMAAVTGLARAAADGALRSRSPVR